MTSHDYDNGSKCIGLYILHETECFYNKLQITLEKSEDPEGSQGSEENDIKPEGEHLYHN